MQRRNKKKPAGTWGISACSPAQPPVCQVVLLWGNAKEPQRETSEHQLPPCPFPQCCSVSSPSDLVAAVAAGAALSCLLRANIRALKIPLWALSSLGNLPDICWRQMWTVATSCSTLGCLPLNPICAITAYVLFPLSMYPQPPSFSGASGKPQPPLAGCASSDCHRKQKSSS